MKIKSQGSHIDLFNFNCSNGVTSVESRFKDEVHLKKIYSNKDI